MSTVVRNDHELLLKNLLDGKLPSSLPWHDVIDLVTHLGEVIVHGGEEFTFVVGSQRLKFKRPHHGELDTEETSRLRKFFRESRTANKPSASVEEQVIVVVDHHLAHIYSNFLSSDTFMEEVVKPYDPFGFHHHLIHRKEAHYQGDRVPEESSYYEEIAANLGHQGPITLVGHAKGKSSAMDHLLEFLKAHHPDLFKRVRATDVLDLSALTELQIEAIVRERLTNSK